MRTWSRETGSAVPSRLSLLISIFRLNPVLTYGVPPDFRSGVHSFIDTVIRHRASPEFIGSRHCVPMARVCRHRTKRVLPWMVTIDQSICASFSHTHSWYEALHPRLLIVHFLHRHPSDPRPNVTIQLNSTS